MARDRKYYDWLSSAASIQREANRLELGRPRLQHDEIDADNYDLLELFDELVTSIPLRDVTRSLFRDSYYTQAVEEAFKCLHNAVREKSKVVGRSGADLMRKAFSANDPILKINAFKTESDASEQKGYMEIFAGSMTGIRNPRAHEPDLKDDPKVALELLVLANHLMRKLDSATKSQTQV